MIPRFGPDTFLELEKLEDAYLTFEIDLALKIESPDGLILFTGQSDKIDADYISFGLKEGYPIFRYALCITHLNHLFLLYKHSIHPSQGDCYDIN